VIAVITITVLGSEWGSLKPVVFIELDLILLPSKKIIPDVFFTKKKE
jgi:hypothetical protein